jgi:hypothetical protein
MALQVTIPDKDPLITHLERRAIKRGMATDKKSARKKASKLARALLNEHLSDLEKNGDPLELRS